MIIIRTLSAKVDGSDIAPCQNKYMNFLQLINKKCMPSLLYGPEACLLVMSELGSLDFIANRFFYEDVWE